MPSPASIAAARAWLAREFSERLASVFETMAGERPRVASTSAAALPFATAPPSAAASSSAADAPSAAEPSSAAASGAEPSGTAASSAQAAPGAMPPGPGEPANLVWRQPFAGLPGNIWICAAEPAWTLAAGQVLRGAGIDDADRATLESTYLETLGQALGGTAQAISARLGREVTPAAGEKSAGQNAEDGADGKNEPPGDAEWTALDVAFATGSATLYVAPETELLDALASEPASESGGDRASATTSGALPDPAENPQEASKTFDLLLDVEMPVSVSFGRAQVQLKDVLKLTTGSIVELNRSIVEPVEVIVNNCVIARGEVVVVEGNFGVRIQHVVSRQERLRSLN